MDSDNLDAFIGLLPKAELHIHIEGTLEPELMFAIAKRNNLTLRFENVEQVRRAYQFENLQSFLDIYYEGAKVLIHQRDFYDLTWAYLEKAAEQNVRHAEIFFDPQTHTDRGIAFATVIDGIHAALSDAERKFGITSSLIMCFLRHLSQQEAIKTLEMSLPHKDKILGVGLDSSESGNPPEKFVDVYKLARDAGYRAVAHAGEEGPAEYIWQALDLLKVSRIDHGVRCMDDPKLVERLVRERIPLTVCPLSNLKLCVVPSLQQHPLKAMLDAGLCVTINSDDPAYFGGYVLKNFTASAQALNLSPRDLAQIAKNGFEASFISRQQQDACHQEIDQLLQAHIGVRPL